MPRMYSEVETSERVLREGIREKIMEVLDYDIFYNYGVLIASSEAVFDLELVGNTCELVKKFPAVLKMTRIAQNLDW